MAEYKEVFMLFDKDEDGVLSFPELAVVMKSLGQRPSGTYLLILKNPILFGTKLQKEPKFEIVFSDSPQNWESSSCYLNFFLENQVKSDFFRWWAPENGTRSIGRSHLSHNRIQRILTIAF